MHMKSRLSQEKNIGESDHCIEIFNELQLPSFP